MWRLRVSTWAAAAVLAAVAATACGGGGGSGAAVASASGASAKNASAKAKSDPQQAGLDFARCMREHGVDVPDPESGQGGFAVRIGGGPGDASASASAGAAGPATAISAQDDGAFEACRHFLDEAVSAGGQGPSDPEMAERALKFAQCMREHGVDMPDPQVSGGSVSFQIAEGMDPNSPTLQAAHEACSEFFGPPGGAKGGGQGGFVTSNGRRS